jgi:hypothetical protein
VAASLANRGGRYINRIAEADGIAPPLAPDTQPYWATARDGSRYVAVRLYPRTLNELRKFSRDFGRPAARAAEWHCVTTWLMNVPPQTALSNPAQVVTTAVHLVQEYDRIRFGWPTHDGRQLPPARLSSLSPEVQKEALRVAAETLCDWRRAGRPHLDRHRIKATYQYLVSCPAFIERYIKEQE